MADTRLYLESCLEEGGKVRLSEAQSRKLVVTLRLGLGAPVRVFNARDGEWRAEIDAKDRQGVALRVRHLLRAPRPGPDLELLFAPVKRHATDFIVEKATELGVSRIRPVITQRTIAETVRTERLAGIAREAAEQCERLDVPEVCEPVSLARALDGWDGGRPLVYADEAGDDETQAWGGERGRAQPVLGALAELCASQPAAGAEGTAQSASTPAGRRLALLIGPEGGFSPEERRMLRSLKHVVPISLGPRILRAETAAIAGLAVLQAACGD